MVKRTRFGLVLVVVIALHALGTRGAVLALELKEGVERLAVKLAESAPEGRTLRVAVTDFSDLQGVVSDLGRYIAERLTTRLSARVLKFRVIERRRLGQVLRELGFTMSGLVDPNKAKQLGKMLGVEAIIVGTLSDLGNIVDVDARIIEIEPNRVLPGVTVTISKDNTVSRMIASGRSPVGGTTGVIAPSLGPLASSPAPSSPEIVKRAKPLKVAAAALAEKAAKGLQGHHSEAGRTLIAEYNFIARQAKAVLKTDAFAQSLEEVTGWYKVPGGKQQYSYGDVMAGKIARLAKGMEIYLASFNAGKAFKEMAGALAKEATKELQRHQSEAGGSLIAEYNLLVREAKTFFKSDSYIQALEEAKEASQGDIMAGTVAVMAKGLETALESHSK